MIAPKLSFTRFSLAVAGSALPLLAWWLIKRLFHISDLYLPSVSSVVDAALTIEPSIVVHVAVTSSRLMVGFVVGTILGIGTAIALARWPLVDPIILPLVHALRAVPAAATVPFFLLWFGFSEFGKQLVVLSAVGLNVSVASHEILAIREQPYQTFFNTYGLHPGTFPIRYSLPRILENILPTLRYSLTVSIGAVIVAELLGAQVGLGYLIQSGRSTFSFALMFLAAFLIGLITVIFDVCLRLAWKRIVFWRPA